MNNLTSRVATAIFILCFQANAQTIEGNFHSPQVLKGADIGLLEMQPDGKLLLGGHIRYVGDTPVNNLIRLNPDGSLDNTFNFDPTENLAINHLAIQTSGEIIAAAANRLFRLTSTGSIQNSVDVPGIRSIALQENGDILVAGGTFFPETAGYLKRFTSDLSSDEEFNATVTADGIITDVAVHNDRIIISGNFTHVNGIPNNDLAKLHTNGTVDVTFNTGAGTSDYIGSITIQSDGKILLGNSFINSFNNIPHRGIGRINTDGSVDDSFLGTRLNGPTSMVKVFNGKIYLAAFLDYGGSTQDSFFKLNEDGSLDDTFPPIVLNGFEALTAAFHIDGNNILLGGTQRYGNPFSRFTLDGQLDPSFKPELLAPGKITTFDHNGEFMIIGGNFLKIDGHNIPYVAKLDLEGNVDPSFSLVDKFPELNTVTVVFSIKIVDDETYFISLQENFIKVDEKGNLYPDFNWAPFDYLSYVNEFFINRDGSITAGNSNGVRRINPDGSKDQSFNPGNFCCTLSTAYGIDMQPDGKLLFGSIFDSIEGITANKLVRLDTNGGVDPSFSSGTGPDANISIVRSLPDTTSLITGFFLSYNGTPVEGTRILKLKKDGSLDLEFLQNITEDAFPDHIIKWRKRLLMDVPVYGTFFTHKIISLFEDGNSDNSIQMPEDLQIEELSEMKVLGNQLYVTGKFYVAGEEAYRDVLKIDLPYQPVIESVKVTEMTEDTSLELKLRDIVLKSDTLGHFTINISDGEHYTVSGNVVTPALDYTGSLLLTLTVTQDEITSAPLPFTMKVVPINDAPVIEAINRDLIISNEGSFTVELSDLTVTDPDNEYPDDFSLAIMPGDHYTVEGNSIIPEPNFTGMVEATLSVNDGAADSEPFKVEIDVKGPITSAETIFSKGMEVYPTTVNDVLIIDATTAVVTPREVALVDLSGKSVHRQTLIGKTLHLVQLNLLPPGFYITRITTDKGSVTIKLTKQ